MKDSSNIALWLLAIGTIATVGMAYLSWKEAPKESEPVCLYIDEYGYCYQTRIY